VSSSMERMLTRPSIFLLSGLAGWHGVLYKGRAESASVLIRSTGTFVSADFGGARVRRYIPVLAVFGSLPLTVW